MFEYCRRSHDHTLDGVEILRCRLTFPSFSDKCQISDFYREIFETALRFCQKDLSEYAEKQYMSCDIPQKRFRYLPILYDLNGKVTYTDTDIMFVKLSAQAKRISPSGNSICVYDAHAWSLYDQCMIPPRAAARQFITKGRLPRQLGKNGFLIENEKPYICYQDHLEEIVTKQ